MVASTSVHRSASYSSHTNPLLAPALPSGSGEVIGQASRKRPLPNEAKVRTAEEHTRAAEDDYLSCNEDPEGEDVLEEVLFSGV